MTASADQAATLLASHRHDALPPSGSPVEATQFAMPHEGTRQNRTWMAWPTADYMLSSEHAPVGEVCEAWAAVANAISEYQPVAILVHPKDRAAASKHLSATVEQHVVEIDDAWMRDSGPTFVRNVRDGSLAAVSWIFNAWGGLTLADTSQDNRVAAYIADHLDVPVVVSPLVNEGGGIHTDGAGTVLVTETVQLDPFRNPGLTRADVEQELMRTIGARRTIWLPRGLHRDYGPLGTRGHVDMVATFSSPGTVLLHAQQDPAHPDHALTAALKTQLAAEKDASGLPLSLIDLPAPAVLRDRSGPVDYNYVNHALVNGAVIACSFGDPADDVAAGILADAYPGRTVVSIDARPIFALGGGIHCITQQQPDWATSS